MKKLVAGTLLALMLTLTAFSGCDKNKEEKSVKEKQTERCREMVKKNAKQTAIAASKGSVKVVEGTKLLDFKVLKYSAKGDVQGFLVEVFIDFNSMASFRARYACLFEEGTTKGESQLISYKSQNGKWKRSK